MVFFKKGDVLRKLTKIKKLKSFALQEISVFFIFLSRSYMTALFYYNVWSDSLGRYRRMDSTGQSRMRQRSLMVLVEISLLCFKR